LAGEGKKGERQIPCKRKRGGGGKSHNFTFGRTLRGRGGRKKAPSSAKEDENSLKTAVGKNREADLRKKKKKVFRQKGGEEMVVFSGKKRRRNGRRALLKKRKKRGGLLTPQRRDRALCICDQPGKRERLGQLIEQRRKERLNFPGKGRSFQRGGKKISQRKKRMRTSGEKRKGRKTITVSPSRKRGKGEEDLFLTFRPRRGKKGEFGVVLRRKKEERARISLLQEEGKGKPKTREKGKKKRFFNCREKRDCKPSAIKKFRGKKKRKGLWPYAASQKGPARFAEEKTRFLWRGKKGKKRSPQYARDAQKKRGKRPDSALVEGKEVEHGRPS